MQSQTQTHSTCPGNTEGYLAGPSGCQERLPKARDAQTESRVSKTALEKEEGISGRGDG